MLFENIVSIKLIIIFLTSHFFYPPFRLQIQFLVKGLLQMHVNYFMLSSTKVTLSHPNKYVFIEVLEQLQIDTILTQNTTTRP